MLQARRYEYDVERAVYLTVLHRLFGSGSDRAAERWRENYLIPGTEALDLHQLYRGMAFLGDEVQLKGTARRSRDTVNAVSVRRPRRPPECVGVSVRGC